MHSIESRFVTGPSNILCALFSLEILQAGAVKGLILCVFFVCGWGGGGVPGHMAKRESNHFNQSAQD